MERYTDDPHTKSLLFITYFDPISQSIVKGLKQNPDVEKQLLVFPLYTREGKKTPYLPKLVKEVITHDPRKVPMLVPAGINQLIIQHPVLEWLRNHMFSKSERPLLSAVIDRTPDAEVSAALEDGEFDAYYNGLFNREYLTYAERAVKGTSHVFSDSSDLAEAYKPARGEIMADRTDARSLSRTIDSKLRKAETMYSEREHSRRIAASSSRVDPRGHPMMHPPLRFKPAPPPVAPPTFFGAGTMPARGYGGPASGGGVYRGW